MNECGYTVVIGELDEKDGRGVAVGCRDGVAESPCIGVCVCVEGAIKKNKTSIRKAGRGKAGKKKKAIVRGRGEIL